MDDQAVTESQQTQYDYVGTNVQIGGGFGGMKPLAQNGSVVMDKGTLYLYDSNGQLINNAPLSAVEVKSLWYTMGGTAKVMMNGKSYSVAIGHGQFLLAPTAALGVTTAATPSFIKAFKQLSGK